MDKKFYCHYDEITFEILQIGPNKICDLNRENIKSFEIPFDPIAKSILLGETSINEWKIIIDDNNRLILSNKKDAHIIRINTLDLIEIKNIGKTNKLITLFITKKKDPTILFDIIKTKKWAITEEFSVYTNKQYLIN